MTLYTALTLFTSQGVHLLTQSAAVSWGLSRNILLTKPHVTHKTVDIAAYRVTDFKTEIRCGQNVVQQIVVLLCGKYRLVLKVAIQRSEFG